MAGIDVLVNIIKRFLKMHGSSTVLVMQDGCVRTHMDGLGKKKNYILIFKKSLTDWIPPGKQEVK